MRARLYMHVRIMVYVFTLAMYVWARAREHYYIRIVWIISY